MNFVNLSELYYAIAPHAAGFNEISALDELRRATRAFAHASMVSQETIQTTAPANNALLAIEAPDTDVEPVGVLWLMFGGRRLNPINLDELMRSDPRWRTRIPGAPCHFAQELPDELTLIPAPAIAEAGVFMRVCYQPTRTADKIDETLVRHYEEGLIDGALYRILRIPGQTWTNAPMAEQAQERYEMAISRARADARRNLQLNAPIHTPLRPLA